MFFYTNLPDRNDLMNTNIVVTRLRQHEPKLDERHVRSCYWTFFSEAFGALSSIAPRTPLVDKNTAHTLLADVLSMFGILFTNSLRTCGFDQKMRALLLLLEGALCGLWMRRIYRMTFRFLARPKSKQKFSGGRIPSYFINRSKISPG